FFYRCGFLYIYAYCTHTDFTIFVNIEKWCVMQFGFIGWSSVTRKGINSKAVFTRFPNHWRNIGFTVGYLQSIYKKQFSLLCFGVPNYRSFFRTWIEIQNVCG